MHDFLLEDTRAYDAATSEVKKGPSWSLRVLASIGAKVGQAGLELARRGGLEASYDQVGALAVQRTLLIVHCEMDYSELKRASLWRRGELEPLHMLMRAEQTIVGASKPMPDVSDDKFYVSRPGRGDLLGAVIDLSDVVTALASANQIDAVAAHRVAMGI